MKREFSLALVAACFLSVVACGQKAPTWQEQYDLGVRYLAEGNYEEAIIAFTAAIEIDPKRAEAHVGRGNAYMLSGETEENLAVAKADYEKAIELDELFAEAYLGLADAYVALGDSESVVDILRQGAETIGDDSLFQTRIDELTAETEQSPELSSESSPKPTSGPRVERIDNPDNDGYRLSYYDEAGNRTREEWHRTDSTLINVAYYDEVGNMMRGDYYNEDGTLNQINYFDAAGNWVRHEVYDRAGNLIDSYIYD